VVRQSVAVRTALRFRPIARDVAIEWVCFTPSVSASVFRAWYGVSYSYDDYVEHSFLAQDLSVRCDGSDDHSSILAVAWISACAVSRTPDSPLLTAPAPDPLWTVVCLWPIGMALLYIAVLLPCRYEIFDDSEEPTPIMQATAFLWRDYKAS
jgi:hypothetical protein